MTVDRFPSFTDLTEQETKEIVGHFKSFGLTKDSEPGPEDSRFPDDRTAWCWACEAYVTIVGIFSRREGVQTMKIEDELRPYTNGTSRGEHVPLDLLKRVIIELEFLRSRAGAMTQGESFSDIARRAGRVEPNPETPE